MPSGKKFFGELIKHWKAMPRGDGRVPSKTAFSPMRLYKMLPYFYFSERIEKYNIRLRLMGDALEESARTMVPNRNVFESFPETDWERAEDYYHTVCFFPCAGHMVRTVTLASGLVYDMETIALPLANRDGEPSYLMGLAQMTKNSAKSLEVERYKKPLNEIRTIDFLDLGYGTPSRDEEGVKEHVNVTG